MSPPRSPADFVVRDLSPAYRSAHEKGVIQERARAATEALASCELCPRACGVDRRADEPGWCLAGRRARVASAGPHHGEEDCLRGWRGSGTVFFGGCNLQCAFCQNADISCQNAGREVSAVELAEVMLQLQQLGCHNINLVTPDHVVPQVLEALEHAVPLGLEVPLVFNGGGYSEVSTLRLLDGIVDIYMPDFKVWSREPAAAWLRAPDYPEKARAALAEMHRQVGDLHLDPKGIARRGVLLRHLVMPGMGRDTRSLLRWIAENVSMDTFVNLMGQYRPEHRVRPGSGSPPPLADRIRRRPTPAELAEAASAAREVGLWRLDLGV